MWVGSKFYTRSFISFFFFFFLHVFVYIYILILYIPYVFFLWRVNSKNTRQGLSFIYHGKDVVLCSHPHSGKSCATASTCICVWNMHDTYVTRPDLGEMFLLAEKQRFHALSQPLFKKSNYWSKIAVLLWVRCLPKYPMTRIDIFICFHETSVLKPCG